MKFFGGGKDRPALLADVVESVIGAIYLDSGIEEAEKFIIKNLQETIEKAYKGLGVKDYKTILQEKLQEKGEVQIEYKVVDEKGPDHEKIFTVELKCDGKILTKGKGKNKKEAEMMAAKKALEE